MISFNWAVGLGTKAKRVAWVQYFFGFTGAYRFFDRVAIVIVFGASQSRK
jgi:hypothetical protein